MFSLAPKLKWCQRRRQSCLSVCLFPQPWRLRYFAPTHHQYCLSVCLAMAPKGLWPTPNPLIKETCSTGLETDCKPVLLIRWIGEGKFKTWVKRKRNPKTKTTDFFFNFNLPPFQIRIVSKYKPMKKRVLQKNWEKISGHEFDNVYRIFGKWIKLAKSKHRTISTKMTKTRVPKWPKCLMNKEDSNF